MVVEMSGDKIPLSFVVFVLVVDVMRKLDVDDADSDEGS